MRPGSRSGSVNHGEYLRRSRGRAIFRAGTGGGIKPDDVRALSHVREREKADIALFISLEQPTAAMVKDAASAGFYESPNGKKYARLQLLTIDAPLDNTRRAEHPDYEPELQKGQSGSGGRAAASDLNAEVSSHSLASSAWGWAWGRCWACHSKAPSQSFRSPYTCRCHLSVSRTSSPSGPLRKQVLQTNTSLGARGLSSEGKVS